MKGEHKARNLVLLGVAGAMAISMTGMLGMSKAQRKDTFIPTETTYENEGSMARIAFLMDEVNREIYDIQKVTEKGEQKTIYDKETSNGEQILYETDKNGEYTFVVEYVEKVEVPKEETEKKAEQRPVQSEEAAKDEQENGSASKTSQIADTPTTLEESAEESANVKDEDQQSAEDSSQADEGSTDNSDKVDEGASQEPPATLEEPVQPTEEEPESAQPQYEYVEKQIEMTVVVDGIKVREPDKSENNDDEPSLIDGDSTASDDYLDNGRPVGRDAIGDNESVNLENQFISTGVKEVGGTNTSYTTSLDSNDYSLSGNTLRLGDKSDYYKNQTIGLISKYTIDFNRSFEIIGSLQNTGAPDGMTISFHQNKNYKVLNSGGAMGVYRGYSSGQGKPEDSDPGHYRANGISNGIVAEIDCWNAPDQSSLGDPWTTYPTQRAGAHLSIQRTVANGQTNKNYAMTQLSSSDFSTSFYEYKLKWDANTEKMTLSYHGKSIIADLSSESNIDAFKNSRAAYVMFTNSVNFNKDFEPSSPLSMKLTRIAYTDFNPHFETKIFNEDGTEATYVLSGSTVIVQHEMWNTGERKPDGSEGNGTNYPWNEKGQPNRMTDKLAMKAMDLNVDKDNPSDVRRLDIVPGSHEVKEGDGSWESHADHTFSRDKPIYPYVPNRAEHFYVRYKVLIPDDAILDGKDRDNLHLSYLAGEDGMTQYSFIKDIDVLDQPKIYSKSGETQNTVYDVIHQPAASAIETSLWQSLYGKTSKDDSEVALSKDGTYTNFSISYSYRKNLAGEGTTTLPANIQKGDIISFHLTITDSTTNATNTFVRYCMTSDSANIGSPASDDNAKYYIGANNTLPELSETKIVTMSPENYGVGVVADSGTLVLQVDAQGAATILDGASHVTVPDQASYVNGSLGPGEHEIWLQYSAGESSTQTAVKQVITENTYSYAEDGKTTDDGAVGFIVIPKRVPLDDSGHGEATVEFSGYEAASAVSYNVEVDSGFTLTDMHGTAESLSVQPSYEGSDGGANGGRLSIGPVSLLDKEKKIGLNVTNLAAIGNAKSQWIGTMQFYFTRNP